MESSSSSPDEEFESTGSSSGGSLPAEADVEERKEVFATVLVITREMSEDDNFLKLARASATAAARISILIREKFGLTMLSHLDHVSRTKLVDDDEEMESLFLSVGEVRHSGVSTLMTSVDGANVQKVGPVLAVFGSEAELDGLLGNLSDMEDELEEIEDDDL